MSSLVSKLTISTIGLASKALLNLGFCCSVNVHGLHNLTDALSSKEREGGRGVITMSNHISTLDDPVVWGILPAKYYWNTRKTRWVLGASDIMFTNPIFSYFFRNGQVLETFRGNGIFQPAVDSAIEKLNRGDWIHLFGEGKVNQPLKPPAGEISQHHANLLRFKWGVGRIIMEARKPPLILPMWLTGFEDLMPEGRPFPYKFLPRRGVDLSITFGAPIPNTDIIQALNSRPDSDYAKDVLSTNNSVFDGVLEKRSAATAEHGWLANGNLGGAMDHVSERSAVEIERVRSAVTAIIQQEVEALGREVVTRTLR
ncbi:acyltransferase-domain-containing protein [Cristinia sonorae]|uniref:Tafazzin family protein n=1 Tax=Cristinia sonorae TaxID=1940300 RepID=A0A8K0UV82_9AGAR|nr:acyltransferase-domain-containing protein [Cristinia sonorae]